MRVRQLAALIAPATLLPLLMGQACPLLPPPQPPSTELTAAERAAVDTAIEVAAALSQATGVAQLPADPSIIPEEEPDTNVMGTCPVVTTTALEEGLGRILTIGFGASPCPPEVFPGLSCSGSATGALNRADRTVALNFNSLSCDSTTLNGLVQAIYDFSPSGVNLNGSFNLTWLSEGRTFTITGNTSLIGHDRVTHATTIGSLNALVSEGDATYTVSLADVVVSYQNNANLIPSAGVIVISGPNIRTLTIRFNAESPVTGEAEVRIGGGPFFTVNLLAL